MKNYILIVVLFFSVGLCAQNIYTGYYSNAFLLKSNLNPAAFPEGNVILGFPALSNFNFGMQLPLSLNELFEKLLLSNHQCSHPKLQQLHFCPYLQLVLQPTQPKDNRPLGATLSLASG